VTGPRMLVVAKAPVPGEAKTRLGRVVGAEVAADLAAASLLDTLRACTVAVGAESCHVAITGDLSAAARQDDVRRALRGPDFATRLANAHLDMPPDRPVVQVGMDTPQLDPAVLLAVGAQVADHDAVLGPAPDGGWWVLALRDPGRAGSLVGVPMSTSTTCRDTRRALEADGLRVAEASRLVDVDTVGDAEQVASQCPHTEFARAWRAR
jgi:uncharacterized protein